MPEIEESPLKILRRQAVQKIQDRSRRAREEESTASSASPTRALPETPEVPQAAQEDTAAPLGSGEMPPVAPGEPAHPSLLGM